MNLNGTWKLQDFPLGEGLKAGAHEPSFADDTWLPIDVPGDVHTALIKAGHIPDPFYGTNETECAWMEEREWWYRRTFNYEGEGGGEPGERLRLVFHGLDTFARG